MPRGSRSSSPASRPTARWTWRAAGAREPRGVLDGAILPAGSPVGDQLRVETEQRPRRHHACCRSCRPKDRSERSDCSSCSRSSEPSSRSSSSAPTRDRTRAGATARATATAATAVTGDRVATATARRPIVAAIGAARRPGGVRGERGGARPATQRGGPRRDGERARIAGASGRTSRRRPRFPSAPSRSGCARASSTATEVLAATPGGAAPGRRAGAAGPARRSPAPPRGQRPAAGRGQARDAGGHAC